MEVLLVTVGKWKASPERALFEDYVKRLPWKLTLRELDTKERDDVAKQKLEEAERILAACQAFGAHKKVALDERGGTMKSRELASLIGRWRDEEAVSKMAWIIGGHAGLDASVAQSCDKMLSFGAMTWPHLLVRTMVAEQLYRSYAILTNHPYHRD